MQDTVQVPTIKKLEEAREAFEEREPRDLFYRAATELLRLTLTGGQIRMETYEALAVLLQTWNQAYYRYTPFDQQHFFDIEGVVHRHEQDLAVLRERAVTSFSDEDRPLVERVFGDFEEVLGPVGAAKALHLLAPPFFPLWDRAIAKAYRLSLGERRTNARRYSAFMRITKRQCESLSGEFEARFPDRNLLKAIDEYNYCKYTKGWI